MNYALIPDDFPLYAIGNSVYRRTLSSPLCQVADERLAREMVIRLNMTANTGVGVGGESVGGGLIIDRGFARSGGGVGSAEYAGVIYGDGSSVFDEGQGGSAKAIPYTPSDASELTAPTSPSQSAP